MISLNEAKPVYSERDFRFLQSIARCEKEEFPNGVYITKWKLALQKKIDHIEQLLVCNEKWIAGKLGKPFRDARPKKLLRKLGLLPPV